MISLFVDNLTTIDFSYLDPNEGLIGETYLVDVELGGAQDDQGMLLDFSRVKKLIKAICDETLDHSLVVPVKSANLSLTKKSGQVELQFDFEGELLKFKGPMQSVALLDTETITTESCRQFLEEQIREKLPENIVDLKITLRTETISGAFYRYSHGLKKHDGNCQRIAHGHRSRIEVYENGQRVEDAERLIANIWDARYIGSRVDLFKETIHGSTSYYQFSYKSGQGDFFLELSVDRCYLIDSDSTVESIAEYLQTKLLGIFDKSYRVKAFEGLAKGAVFHN
ncbi:MAG: 6-carboxytetrahydropterin synthase [Calditrichaeota bacterium]|nr:6-carboxytetrahydropterin synthase [Calditrichota bacterium]